MKVQCPKCSTAYRLPDERLPAGEGNAKVRCKRCGHVIDVVRPVADAGADETKWFVAVGSERKGPYSRDDICRMIGSSEVVPESFIWKKGFKAWEKIADVAEFQAEFAPIAGDVEPETDEVDFGDGPVHEPQSEGEGTTQMVSLDQIQASMSTKEAAPSVGTQAGNDKDGLLWQRRETSVLFSLDDYRVRKKTQGTPAIGTTGDGLLGIKPIDTAAPSTLGAAPATRPTGSGPKVGVISLDEAEVKHVAETLARRKKRRNFLVIGLGAVGGLIVVGGIVAILLVFTGRETTAPAGKTAAAEAAEAEKAAIEKAAAEKIAIEKAAIEKAAAEKIAAEKAAIEKAAAEKIAAEKAAAEKAAEKTPAEKAAAKAAAEKAAAEKAAKAGTAKDEPAAGAAEKKGGKKAAAATNTDDVNALLASYRQGKDTGTPAKTATAAKTTEDDSTLPEKLSSGQINNVLGKKRGAVTQCLQGAGFQAGTAVKPVAKLVIGGSGDVVTVSVSGAGGGQGCIETALRGAKFPKFKSESMPVTYPFAIEL